MSSGLTLPFYYTHSHLPHYIKVKQTTQDKVTSSLIFPSAIRYQITNRTPCHGPRFAIHHSNGPELLLWIVVRLSTDGTILGRGGLPLGLFALLRDSWDELHQISVLLHRLVLSDIRCSTVNMCTQHGIACIS